MRRYLFAIVIILVLIGLLAVIAINRASAPGL